jgi:hypothetical protein
VADLNISVPHNLSQDEAFRRIHLHITNLRTQYAHHIQGFQEDWKGNTGAFRGTVKGQHVVGTVTVNSSDVTVQGRLPVIAFFMRGRIEKGIREELGRLLS